MWLLFEILGLDLNWYMYDGVSGWLWMLEVDVDEESGDF